MLTSIACESCTSPNVCELWDGSCIVRVVGSPDTIELLYNLDFISDEAINPGDDGIYVPVATLPKPHTGLSWIRSILRNILGIFTCFLAPQSYDAETVIRAAPNITSNTAGKAAPLPELVVIAFVGVFLQIGVLVFDAFMAYNIYRPNKGSPTFPSYGFPLNALGTVATMVGMFTCAYVIQTKTIERRYTTERETRAGERLQILWIQRSQICSDQEFDSYAIHAQKNKKELTVSRPAGP